MDKTQEEKIYKDLEKKNKELEKLMNKYKLIKDSKETIFYSF